jgi:neutral ceramidase
VQEQIVDLVRKSLAASAVPCTLDYQVADEAFSYNREGMTGVERDEPVLTARALGGSPLVVMFGYGCHPVVASADTLIDPDYPGLAVEVIEQQTGGFAEFLTGAAGDQDPVAPRGWQALEDRGRGLGQTVIDAVAV